MKPIFENNHVMLFYVTTHRELRDVIDSLFQHWTYTITLHPKGFYITVVKVS